MNVRNLTKRRTAGRLIVTVTTLASTAVVAAATAPPAAASTADWLQTLSSQTPAARDSAAVAYDDATDQAVLFGGETSQGSNNYLGDTWVWAGGQWFPKLTLTSPSARQGPAAAYDATSGQVVLFGGYRNGFLDDTWVWNGQTWTQQHPAVSPPARDYMGMAYDPVLGGVVLTGGLSDGTPLSDTWLWAGSTWTQLHPATSPPARYGASLVYDPGLRELVEFGGLANGNPALNDVWAFNGVTWSQVSVAGSPSPRSAQHIVYDPDLGGELLFGGGLSSSSAFFNDTWKLVNGTWTQLAPATTPSARANAATFYDSTRCEMVVFGGSTSGSTDVNDTWTYRTCDNSGPASDDCAGTSAQTVADGWAGDVYGRVRIFQPAPNVLWVCVRVDGEGLDTGGKLIVTFPSASLPGSPGTSTDPQACTNEPGNQITTNHPIESGSVGGGVLPLVTFLLDAYSNSQETWVCVEAGPVQDVLIVDGASATPPGVEYIPDPPGGQAPPEPAPTSSVSGSCQTQPSAIRLVDMTTAGPSRLYAFASQPAAGEIALCVRADVPSPAPSVGGVLTLNPAGVLGSVPAVGSYAPTGVPGSDPNCPQPVASISNPQFAVFVSAPGGPQPTLCIYPSVGAPVGATVTPPAQPAPSTLTWTPDPGTPIPAFSH